MKVVALPTISGLCSSVWRSIEISGHEVTAILSDGKNDDEQFALVESVRAITPDVIVYFGGVPEHAQRRMLTIDTLCRLKEIAPHILLCFDGGDEPWHPWLKRYAEAKCFSIQVNIDGCAAPECITTLTPFDNRDFFPLPWNERPTHFGIVCSAIGGGPRQFFIDSMRNRYGMHVYTTGQSLTYSEFAKAMSRIKIIFNHGMRGSTLGQHIKGRVIEAGWAGSALFDHVDSPTSRWFDPGVEYFTYNTVEDVGNLLQLPDDVLHESARRLNERVKRDYSPAVIWQQIFSHAGVVG